LKGGGAKLKGLRFSQLCQPAAEYDYHLTTDYEYILGGFTMFIFIAGLFVGSFSMLTIMSLMVAAKRGDQLLESQRKIESVY
jgi:hypothetical protein